MTLYRKHRPRSFADVVGQDHAVTTLRNAITRGRVSHAYLLTGPHGTGKTTLARLLAAALNAPGGPTPDFDPETEQAQRILEGTSLELVSEINAAQQNGIDDIRDLTRAASMAAVEGSTKVYILDEAHNYSGAAANALLKLIEEPPSQVVFVLATTEPSKVLSTIRSRCQRLALARPGVADIARALRVICDREGADVTDGALRLCARAGQGSFRDSIGALDGLMTIADENTQVDEAAASQALGIVGDEIARKLCEAIIASDGAALLQGVEELSFGGQDIAAAADALIGWLRLIYLRQFVGQIPDEDDPGDDAREILDRHAKELTVTETLTCVDWLQTAVKDIRSGVEARVAVEVALLRCATREQQLPARVARLERAAA